MNGESTDAGRNYLKSTAGSCLELVQRRDGRASVDMVMVVGRLLLLELLFIILN